MSELSGEQAECPHGDEAEWQHWFEFKYSAGRNIWNPMEPKCKKCRVSIREIIVSHALIRARLEEQAKHADRVQVESDSLVADCHSFEQQVADLTAKLANLDVGATEMAQALHDKQNKLNAAQATIAWHDKRDQAQEAERDQLQSTLTAQLEEIGRLKNALMWALGYSNFRMRGSDQGPYWWRTELRQRAFPDGLRVEEIIAYQVATQGLDEGKKEVR